MTARGQARAAGGRAPGAPGHAGAARRCVALAVRAAAVLACAMTAPAAAQDVKVSVQTQAAVSQVHGAFVCPVPAVVAWAVLTDYAHLSSFVRSMKASRIEWRDDDRLLVRQEGEMGGFLLHRGARLLLDVREEPGHR